MYRKDQQAAVLFNSFAFTHKREYVAWIIGAKKDETRKKRLQSTIGKLTAGKENYNEK